MFSFARSSSARGVVMAGALAAALGVAACGGSSSGGGGSTAAGPNPNVAEKSPPGDIPDNQAYVAYAPPRAGYSVKVPEGWSRSTASGATTFTDKLNSITMQTRPAASAMSVADATRRDVPKLAHATRGFRAGRVSTVHRHAGDAIRITYTARGAASPVTGRAVTDAVERYVFFHRGRDLILTLSGPKGADNVDPWRIITDSLRWTR
jgi:hypothetical protein